MRFRNLLTFAALALLLAAPAAARAQEQPREDQKVIEDFITTRGVSFEEPSKKAQPKKQPPGGGARKNNSGTNASKKNAPAAKPSAADATASKKNAPAAADGAGASAADGGAGGVAGEDADSAQTLKASAGRPRAIALGYTIYMKDRAGGFQPIDTSQEFKAGDRIAISLETNTDGYLYVFNAEDGKNPVMLLPHVQLDGGANAARAHVRETYPADAEYGFEFDANPATEHLFIVVSREPLPGVPTGEALAKFCGDNVEDCYWKPTAAQWEKIKSGAAGKGVVEAKNQMLLARADPAAVAPGSLTRGIKVKKSDPKPAVVRVNGSPAADSLVTKIELIHK